MIFKWIPCFTVCAQIRRKRLKKKVFFFKKEKKKCDHRHSLKTLPLGGEGGGLNFCSRDRGGCNRQQQRKTRKISLFFFFYCFSFVFISALYCCGLVPSCHGCGNYCCVVIHTRRYRVNCTRIDTKQAACKANCAL